MGDKTRYYIPSRVVPVGGLIQTVIAGTVAGCFGDALYSVLNFYNPFIYINILATIGFGVVVGGCVTWGSTRGHIRFPSLTHVMAIGTSVVGIYFSWIVYIFFLSGDEGIVVVDPISLASVVQTLANLGVWDIKGMQPTGWQLYACWGVEAALICGFAYSSGGGCDKPYCEDCGKWTTAEEHITQLSLAPDQEIRIALEDEDYGILTNLATEEINDAHFLDVSVHSCDSCENSNYMSLDRVAITINSKNEVETATENVVKSIIVPRALTVGLVELAKSQADDETLDEDNGTIDESEEADESNEAAADDV